MRFSEQFPSWNGRSVLMCINGIEYGMLDKGWIQAHCLDKQIVERDYVKKKEIEEYVRIFNKSVMDTFGFMDKQKVIDAIDKCLPSGDFRAYRQIGKTMSLELINHIKIKLLRELDLE